MAQTQPPDDCGSVHSFIAFPKISGKVKEFLSNLKHLKQANKLQGSEIDIEGTVKLHGMHADIVYDLQDSATHAHFQTRNRICEPEESMQGWPRNLSSYSRELCSLKKNILLRFEQKHPTTKIDTTHPLIVAGQWIGSKVQPSAGIAALTTRFVILSIQINGLWQPDADFAGIEEPSAAIYSILRVPQYIVRYDTTDLSPHNPTLLEMQSLADQVEAACPFAAHFGVKNGRGEGIVWKPATLAGRVNAKYWLKMKGPLSDPDNRVVIGGMTSMPAGGGPKALKNAHQAAAQWFTARRVEQAFEYLREMDSGSSSAGQRERAFTKWIIMDIFVEEREEIQQLASNDLTFEKRLRQRIYPRAHAAFAAATARESRGPQGVPNRHQEQQERKERQEDTTQSEVAGDPSSLEHETKQSLEETPIIVDKDPAGAVGTSINEPCCSLKDIPPARIMTDEERFLEAMEKMLR